MVILVGPVDFGDEAAEFNRVLRQEKLREEDASRHVGWGTKLVELLARSERATMSGSPWWWWLGLSRPNTSRKIRPW
jgi:hypothetical protein